MKAALLTSVGKPLELTDVEIPRPGNDEVLVRTHTCGVCRTDLHLQAGVAYVPALPHIPGHEPAGTIVELGRDVRSLRVGQRVVPHLFVRDRECRYTRAGHDAQATHLRGILGVTMPGAFAEYFVAPHRNLVPLPVEVDFAEGGLASCAAVTAVKAFYKSGLQLGDSALVIGCGGIGLQIVQLLVASGVQTVALDLKPQAVEMASSLGATALQVTAKELKAGRPESLETNYECDAAFDLVGRAASTGLAAKLVRRQGRIVIIGEEGEFPAIDTTQIAQRELEIVGSRNGGVREMKTALRLMAQGTLKPPVAARFSLNNINTALEVLRNGGAAGRVVVDVSEDENVN